VVAAECCATFESCRKAVLELSHEYASYIQEYMQGCDLTSDVSTVDGELQIVDTTHLCSETCQSLASLNFMSPRREFETLEARCSHELDRIRTVLNAAHHFDEQWRACSSTSGKEPSDGAENKFTSKMKKDPLNEAQFMPLPTEIRKAHKPRWGPVSITTHWVPPVNDFQVAFETMWSALPVSWSEEFKITGTVGAIQEELLLRPNLPIRCPDGHSGKPVYLVVSSVSRKSADVYRRAWMSGFANMAGISSFAITAPTVFQVGGEGLQLAGSLATNPTSVSLDKVVDYMLDHIHSTKTRGVKKFWRWLTGSRNTAFLTLADPEKKGHTGAKIMFQCNKMDLGGKEKVLATWVDGTDHHTTVTAKHLAFLITSLA